MLREACSSYKLILGIAGRVGTGKSTCRAWLAARGAVAVDCDKLGHAVYAPEGPAYAAVAALFPSAVTSPRGPIDRGKLGALVFSDAAAMSALNAAVWPALRGMVVRALNEEAAARGAGAGSLVGVVEAAILLEAGWGTSMDGVWLLEAPREALLVRLQGRGLEGAAAEARVSAQPSAQERLEGPFGASVTRVINTGGALEETQAQYAAAWEGLLAKAIGEGKA